MPKKQLLILTLTIILLIGFLTLAINSAPLTTPKLEIDTAVNQARFLYDMKKAEGVDFTSGPCLSNALLPGWVLDIVHSPREAIDDSPENQCPAYREGRAEHFVELDTKGNLVRAK